MGTAQTRKITALTHALPVEITKPDGSPGITNRGKSHQLLSELEMQRMNFAVAGLRNGLRKMGYKLELDQDITFHKWKHRKITSVRNVQRGISKKL